MSGTRVTYQVKQSDLLQTPCNPATIEQERTEAPLDLFQIERMLLPLINQVRKAQGKKPVIVPRE